MKEFIRSLFSADGEISSKRVIAFVALILYISIVVSHLFGVKVDQNIAYGTIGLIITSLGMTLFNIPKT